MYGKKDLILWRHHFPHLHNTKTIFQKGKRHSSSLWKAFQIRSNYFLLHRHFKLSLRCLRTCFNGKVLKCPSSPENEEKKKDWGGYVCFDIGKRRCLFKWFSTERKIKCISFLKQTRMDLNVDNPRKSDNILQKIDKNIWSWKIAQASSKAWLTRVQCCIFQI